MNWDLLDYFEDEMVTVNHTTFSGGSYDDAGTWIPGTSTTLPISIFTPQPANSNDLTMLPQGEEAVDVLVSRSEVLVETRDKENDSDIIEWDSYDYKVIQVDKRRLGGFHRFMMTRKRGQV